MNVPFSTSMALLGLIANVVAAVACLVGLIGPRGSWSVLPSLRSSCLKPLALAVVVHWLLYFGPINLGALVLQSNVQEAYSWVIRRPLLAAAALHSLVAYGLILTLMATLAGLLERWGINQQLKIVPRCPRLQLLLVAALLALISALIAPVIGTDGANGGAWVDGLPWLLRPWAKGLYLIEATPLIAVGWQVLVAEAPPPQHQRGSLLLLVALQFTTFVLLRHRFLSLLAVLWVLTWLLRWSRTPLLLLWMAIGLSLAYALPTALRYSRVARVPGQPLAAYLAQSWQNFATGLQPVNLAASALNDFSYNKAGLASLSVVLDLRLSGLVTSSNQWAWVVADLYRALPGAIKQQFWSWGAVRAEESVTRALGVGEAGWSNPGISPELAAHGWIVDLMETPLLDPVTSGGWLGLLSFSLVITVFLVLFWCAISWLQQYWSPFWLLTIGTVSVVALGPNWLGDLLVLVKVSIPWLFMLATLCWFLAPNGGFPADS